MQGRVFGRVIVSSLMAIALVLPSTAFAQNGQTPLPPGLGQRYPSSASEVVSKAYGGTASPLALCDSMEWYATTSVYAANGVLTGYSHSFSRDINDVNYPCDINTIGARNRLWWNNTEVGDTGMLYNYNNSDVSAYNNFSSGYCGSNLAYSRGNHYFSQPGIPVYQPTTDNSC